MTCAKSGWGLLAAMLGLMALIACFTLTTWHESYPHADEPVGLASVHHDHDTRHDAIDELIHVAAHLAGQSIDLPGRIARFAVITAATPTFSTDAPTLLVGREPTSPLPPPRR